MEMTGNGTKLHVFSINRTDLKNSPQIFVAQNAFYSYFLAASSILNFVKFQRHLKAKFGQWMNDLMRSKI